MSIAQHCILQLRFSIKSRVKIFHPIGKERCEMQKKAYDTILSDYVDAESAAKGSGFEPYRYKCACCWEEVHLCAADSRNQATHFRHRNGNNNVECENYLGNRNAIINSALSHRNVRDKIEFYFSNSTKLFSIGVKFDADEISTYEQDEASFQVRTSYTAKPLISIPIRSSRFYPNISELIPISEFSWEYHISSSNDSKPHKCELFRKDKRGYLYPSFFKIQAQGDGGDFKAKLIRSDTLYTNTPYLIVFTHLYHTMSFQQDVKVGEVIRFKTMDRDFAGVVVVFTRKTASVEQQLGLWKYKLETNETLTLVWPPSSLVNESMLICTDYAYLFSTFELQAHGNINVHSDNIEGLENGISKVAIKGRTKIYKKNAEIVLEKCKETSYEYDTISVANEIAKNYVASDDGAYLFNCYGVSPMSKGMSILLTTGSEIRHYSYGYLDSIVTVTKDSVALTSERLLQDVLMYYKRMEAFDWTDYDSLKLSHTAFQYIESCEKTGVINSAAKHFIEEGWI